MICRASVTVTDCCTGESWESEVPGRSLNQGHRISLHHQQNLGVLDCAVGQIGNAAIQITRDGLRSSDD
jgi:hypothetical protein